MPKVSWRSIKTVILYCIQKQATFSHTQFKESETSVCYLCIDPETFRDNWF